MTKDDKQDIHLLCSFWPTAKIRRGLKRNSPKRWSKAARQIGYAALLKRRHDTRSRD